ncbi:hypothetical protein ACWDXH_28280 [Micromonospora chokoriensis]
MVKAVDAAQLSASRADAGSVAERFALKEALSADVPAATAPADSAARQASWVDPKDVVEMSAFDGTVTVAVSRTASSTAFETAKRSVEAARGQSAVTVRRSGLTKDELFAVKVRVAELYENHPAPGGGMGFAFDAARDAVVVEGDVAPDLVERMEEIGHVVVEASPSNRVQRNQGNRYRDTGPWKFGGAAITNLRTRSVCTSGFTMQADDGRPYVVTAGHCGWENNDFESGGSNWYGRADSKPTYPTWDLLRIKCCDAIFGSDYWIRENVSRRQSQAFNPALGLTNVCHSGRVGNQEICGHTVTSLSGSLCSPECTSGLLQYSKNAVSAWPGDSGMAVWTLDGNYRMRVHGMFVGASNTGNRYYAEKFDAVRERFSGVIRNW